MVAPHGDHLFECGGGLALGSGTVIEVCEDEASDASGGIGPLRCAGHGSQRLQLTRH
jgi:hypothetical protein